MITALALILATGLVLGAAPATQAQERPETIDWKHLVPAGYDPTELVRKYQLEVSTLRDNDPRAARAAERLRRAWENAPVVESLNNKVVKLAGYLVTLEGDGKAVSEFLLVPYFGACIHVPPPPSNQVVLVRTGRRPFKASQMFDMVSVTGRLRTERASNELASASYVIEATQVEAHKP
ncbi:MAG TPA: DUF3299 domain-containing protein [Methylomirabilota bacterium]|jgi:hypothetical protein